MALEHRLHGPSDVTGFFEYVEALVGFQQHPQASPNNLVIVGQDERDLT